MYLISINDVVLFFTIKLSSGGVYAKRKMNADFTN